MRIAALFLAVAAWAHEPITTKLTWTLEISRLVYRRCLQCHNRDSAIPLVTYEQARPWAKAIRDEVLERRMPPWGAVRGFGEFRNDASLTQPEIDLIVYWVEGGAPEGNPLYLPETPEPTPGHLQLAGASTTVRREWVLPRPMVFAGIRPVDVAGWMQVTATLPDGSVRPLIWLREWREGHSRTFEFRDPVRLPRGSRVHVEPAGAVDLISASKPVR